MSPRMVGIRLLRIRFFQVLLCDSAMPCAELFPRYNWLIAQAAEPVREIRLHAAICIEVPFVITASSQKTIQIKPFSCRRFFAAISTEPLCPVLCIQLSLPPTHRLSPLLSLSVVSSPIPSCGFHSALCTSCFSRLDILVSAGYAYSVRLVPVIGCPYPRAMRSPQVSPWNYPVSFRRG